MTLLKKKWLPMLLAIITMATLWIPVYASDDNIPYDFKLDVGYKNSYTAGRFRQTTNIYNPWKVDMRYHSRGDNAQATYWLATTSGKSRVSDTLTTTPRVGKVYKNAYQSANQTTVSLGVENFKDQTATVSGYWDEETK